MFISTVTTHTPLDGSEWRGVCRCVDKPAESKVLGSHHHLRCFLTSLRVRRKEEKISSRDFSPPAGR
jgi:hypothetical protein